MLKIALTLRKKENMYFTYQSYIQCLSSSFVIIPVFPNSHINEIVNLCDALIISGGDDVNPLYYKNSLNPYTVIEDLEIESFDFELIHAFYKAHKKIIGICRGIQILNVYFKGTLNQHIENHHSTFHKVCIEHKTFLSKYYQNKLQVNSYHHQSLKDISPLFRINAISTDGIVEGIENNQVLALQWHPEKMDIKQKELFIKMINDFITH